MSKEDSAALLASVTNYGRKVEFAALAYVKEITVNLMLKLYIEYPP